MLGLPSDQIQRHGKVKHTGAGKREPPSQPLGGDILGADKEEAALFYDMGKGVKVREAPVSDPDGVRGLRIRVTIHHIAKGAELILCMTWMDDGIRIDPAAEFIQGVQMDGSDTAV